MNLWNLPDFEKRELRHRQMEHHYGLDRLPLWQRPLQEFC